MESGNGPAQGPHVALVGCGRWGRHILRDLRALGCTVTVVARSPQSQGNATAGGAAAIVTTVEALPAVDGIVVATPTAPRPALIHQLIGREVPIFTEKPLAAGVADAQRLVDAADGRLFVMEKWRYHPGVVAMAGIAQSGEFGAPLGIRSTRISWGINHPDVDAVWTLLPHDLAIIDEILGFIPEAVWAAGEHVGGEPSSLVAALGTDPWAAIEVSAIGRPNKREVRLCCESATIVLGGGFSDHLSVIGPHHLGEPVQAEPREISSDMPLLLELREFVEHLRGGPPPRVSAQRSMRGVETIARLRELAGFDDA